MENLYIYIGLCDYINGFLVVWRVVVKQNLWVFNGLQWFSHWLFMDLIVVFRLDFFCGFDPNR